MPRNSPAVPAPLTVPAAPTSTPAAVETRHLDVFYGEHQVLFDVGLRVVRHEILALIGPSGCGKSTFLRTLNRMNDLVPSARWSGEVLIDGLNFHAPGSDVMALRRKVGMVFQRSNPFPFSIEENVAYGVKINHLARD